MTFFKLQVGTGGGKSEPLVDVLHSVAFTAASPEHAITYAEDLISQNPDQFRDARTILIASDGGAVLWDHSDRR